MIEKLWNYFILHYKGCKTGDHLIIHGKLFIHGRKKGIEIGNNCVITSNEMYNPTAGGNHTHLSVGEKGVLLIGNNVGISQSQISAYEKVEIEDNVLIGANCKIWDTDFHPVEYKKRQINEEAITKPVLIKEGAFIGACSIILKGTIVGSHSVIGAGSVVATSIPDNEIWAGNPAKFIRRVEE